jgi:Na+-translocating ferredoxin:NAD+ oxidoreductase RnfG subunit
MKLTILLLLTLSLSFACKKRKDEIAPKPIVERKVVKIKKPLPKKIVKPVVVKKVIKKVVKKVIKEVVKETILFPLPKNAKDIKIAEKPIYHKLLKVKGKDYIALNSLKVEGGNKILGYHKTIPLEIVAIFDKKGKIYRVLIGSNKETPSFIDEINQTWISKFNNLKIQKPIIGKKGKRIDALTENTMSTEAIKKSVDLLRKEFIKNFIKQPTK